MLDEQLPDVVSRGAVVFECLKNTLRNEVDKQSLTLGGAIGGVILKAIFRVAKVMALLVDIILSHFVVLWRLREHEN